MSKNGCAWANRCAVDAAQTRLAEATIQQPLQNPAPDDTRLARGFAEEEHPAGGCQIPLSPGNKIVMLDFNDHAAIERAAEFTYMEQGIPGIGDMSTMESYKLGFVAGMRLAGEEILKLARDKAWMSVPLERADQDLSAEKVQAIAQAINTLQGAGFEEVMLLSRSGELRLGWK